MFTRARKTLIVLGGLGALALGGSAIAGAARESSTTSAASSQSSSSSSSTGTAAQCHDPRTPGGHVGANGEREQPLSADVAAKVEAAAQKKVAGGTVLRVETDVDHGSPYEAHVRKADGTAVEVLVNESFEVTAVNTMRHHR